MNKPSSSSVNTIKNIILYTAGLAVILNTGDDVFRKIQEHKEKNLAEEQPIPTSTIHYGLHPYTDYTFPESVFSQSIGDIIKRKGPVDTISHSIHYRKDNQIVSIDVSCFIEDIINQSPVTLKSLGETKTEKAYGLLKYWSEDYRKHIDIICQISTDWLDINEEDDYWTKVYKIQHFVWGLGYERDLLYLGNEGQLAAITDHQFSVVANLSIGRMDCNNKTGLFVQLCWANNILVGVGMSQNHTTPAVYTPGSDKLREAAKSNTSFFLAGKEYKGVIVDPTMSDLTHKQPRPRIVGDMKGDPYKDMQFVIIKPQ